MNIPEYKPRKETITARFKRAWKESDRPATVVDLLYLYISVVLGIGLAALVLAK